MSAVALTTLLTACTSGVAAPNASEQSLDPSIQLPPQNQELWVLPVDQYVPSVAQSRKETYAAALLIQGCLAERGMNVPVPRPNLDDGGDRGVRDLFTPEVAERYGYRSPSWVDSMDMTDPWIAFLNRPLSDEYIAAEDECYAHVEVPAFDSEMLNYALSFSNAAFVGAMRDEEVLETAAEWNQCMSGVGIEDLPDGPDGMPTESMRNRLGLDQTPDAGQGVVISPDEREIAVADATCRETTGYADVLYQANWDRQVRLLAENSTALKDIGEKIDKVDAELTQVIAEHAQPES